MFNNGVSLADIAAVTGNNRSNNGMWDNGAWWIIILLIFGYGGFGNGFGGFGGRGQSTSVYEGYVLNNDFSQLSKQISDTYNMTDRKFEGISNGICSLGYDQLAQMNGINTNIMSVGNAIQTQLAQCLKNFKKAINKVLANKFYAVGTYA